MTETSSKAQTNTSIPDAGTVSAPTGVPVPEQEASLRAIGEASRETEWRKPSFAKELYLGRFRLDLIHPHPTSSPEDVDRGEKFLAELRAFCESQVDGALIEREARIPDEVVKGLAELGAFGIKIPREYERSRTLARVLQPGPADRHPGPLEHRHHAQSPTSPSASPNR